MKRLAWLLGLGLFVNACGIELNEDECVTDSDCERIASGTVCSPESWCVRASAPIIEDDASRPLPDASGEGGAGGAGGAPIVDSGAGGAGGEPADAASAGGAGGTPADGGAGGAGGVPADAGSGGEPADASPPDGGAEDAAAPPAEDAGAAADAG